MGSGKICGKEITVRTVLGGLWKFYIYYLSFLFLVWVGFFIYAMVTKESIPMLISCLIVISIALLINLINLMR